AGELAPVDVILHSDGKIDVDEDFLQKVNKLKEDLSNQKGISSVSPDMTDDVIKGNADLPRNFLADDGRAVKLQVILDNNPYDDAALDTVGMLRDKAESLLVDSGLSKSEYQLHYAGQTAEQLDVKQMNKRDMIVLFS